MYADKNQEKLLYEEVVNELYGIIDRQEVKVGQQFPSERELVERWNISKSVLREAFHVLEERGLINARQGKGRFLRAMPNQVDLSRNERLSKTWNDIPGRNLSDKAVAGM